MANISIEAQKRVAELFEMTARAYGGVVGEQYNASPSVAQTLNNKIVEDGHWFLQKINLLPVTEITGQKILLGLTGGVASRTDTTDDGERVPKNLVGLSDKDYECYQTDFDVALLYSTIDAWAKFPDFAERYGRAVSTNAYIGQMFNIHAAQAAAMGKTAFMDELIAKTAKAVQLFNTDGDKMGEAMKNIGKQATAMGVSLEEQLAVMGFAKNTMIEGSRAGTAYNAFLANIAKAETVSGMKFTDQSGKVLPMVEIITKLEARFGDLSKAADQQFLQKMFGKRGQQLLSAMAGSLDTFQTQLQKIKTTQGLDNVIAMATAITDPWDKAAAAIKNLRIQFGDKMLTALEPFYNQVTQISGTLSKWLELFPHLSGVLIKAVFGITGLIAAFAALSIIVGVSKFLMIGWSVAAGVTKLAMLPFAPLLIGIRAGWHAMNLSVIASNGVMKTAKAGMLAMWGTMKFIALQSKLATAALWLFNGGLWGMTTALMANPITWVVLGVVALIGAVTAAIIYWEQWTGVVINFASQFLESMGVFAFVDQVLALWDKLPQWWDQFKNWLIALNPFSFILKSIVWLIDKINLIPGINIKGAVKAPEPIAPPAALQAHQNSTLGGGVIERIHNANTDNRRSIGDIHLTNYGQAINGQQLMDELTFAAG